MVRSYPRKGLFSAFAERLGLAFRFWGRARRVDGVDAILRAARATIRRKRYCLLATRSEAGVDARVLQPFPPDDDLTIWLGTSSKSRKVAQLEQSPEATLVYQDDARDACVVLVGEVRIVTDLEERRRRFMPTWRAFFPEGPEQDYVLLRVEPRRIEVLDFTRRITPEPFGLCAATLVRGPTGWEAT